MHHSVTFFLCFTSNFCWTEDCEMRLCIEGSVFLLSSFSWQPHMFNYVWMCGTVHVHWKLNWFILGALYLWCNIQLHLVLFLAKMQTVTVCIDHLNLVVGWEWISTDYPCNFNIVSITLLDLHVNAYMAIVCYFNLKMSYMYTYLYVYALIGVSDGTNMTHWGVNVLLRN